MIHREPLHKVLVIDDMAEVGGLISAVLEDIAEVRLACSGLDGIRTAAEWVPDLIFCDLRMPVMNGAATVERLRAMDGTRQTPIILLTGLPDEIDQFAGLKSEVDLVFSKPFSVVLLRSAAEQLLQAGPEARAAVA